MNALVVILLAAGIFLAVAAWLIFLTSYHAYRRGYNPIVWMLATMIAMNPIFLFVVLAMVPNRARLRLRNQFRAELDDKLAGHDPRAGVRSPESASLETRTATPAIPPAALDVTRTYQGDDRGRDGGDRPG